jgi:transposase
LEGEDANPYRHQQVEIPPIKPILIEYRLHQLECGECGKSTRAKLPESVVPHHYGTRVVALVAVLSGLYRHSQRTVKIAMAEIFDIRLSLGTINKLRMEASNAVEKAVEEAKTYIQNAFDLWYQVRDGTLTRCGFQSAVEPIRNSLKSTLLETANYEIGSKYNII